ncbi:MAG: hypothetical protein QOG90_1352 [Actinomycetota bacterium]
MHVASLAAILVVLTLACRGQWFFGDEWDFILFRGLHHPIWGLLRPHNEHWSTLPILWWRATYSLFGLRSYWPYLFGLFATHLIVVHAAWRLMRRAEVSAPLATGVALVFGLFGAGSENLAWAFQVGFVGSLAAGMLLLLLVDDRGERRRVALVAAGATASLMLSGMSVFMVGAVGLAALARWGWRKAVAATAPAGVVYLVWLKFQGQVGLEGANKQFHGGPKDIPRYVWGGMSSTLGAPFKSHRIGEALLVVLLAVLVVRGRDWWRRAPVLFALAAASPVMFAVISQGRGAIQNPAAGRYLYLCAGMLLPLIAFAVQQLVDSEAPRLAVALVACLALTAIGTQALFDNVHYDRNVELTLRGQMLASLTIAKTESLVSDRPDFTYAGDVTVAALQRLQRRGELPAFTPTIADLAAARLALEIAVTHERGAPGGFATASVPSDASITRRGACDDVDLHGANAVVARTGDQAIFSVQLASPGTLQLFVPYAGGNAGPRRVALKAGERVTVHDEVVSGLVLQLPGPATICGMTWTKP